MTVRDLKRKYLPNRSAEAIRQKIIRMRKKGVDLPKKIGSPRYGNYYYCVKDGWILVGDAVTTENDKRPRCPYCNLVLRQNSS